MTEEQIAKNCGIHRKSLANMRKKFPDVEEAMAYTKASLLKDIEGTLFRKALEGDKVCIIFSLKNLDPTRWKDVHQVEQRNEVKVIDDLDASVVREIEDKNKGKKKKFVDDIDWNDPDSIEEVH